MKKSAAAELTGMQSPPVCSAGDGGLFASLHGGPDGA